MGEFIFSSGTTSSKTSFNPPYNWINYPFANETFQHILLLTRDTFLQTNIRRTKSQPAAALFNDLDK